MIDGVLFYWIAWFFCIIVLFFMEKNKWRHFFSFWLLMSIICADYYVDINGYRVSITFMITYIGSFIVFAKLDHKTYHLFSAFTVMIGYVSFLLLESNSPIWLFAPRTMLLSLMTTMIIIFLTRYLYPRLMIGLVGICSGEILYHLIVANYQMLEPVGEIVFFDILLLILFMIFIINLGSIVKRKFKNYMTKYQLINRSHVK